MRLLLIVLAAGLAGGAAALGVERLAGWNRQTTTLVVREAAPKAEPAALRAAGRSVFPAAQIYAARSPGVVTVYAYDAPAGTPPTVSQGSGFVVSRRGEILTNAHVITDAGTVAPGAVRAAQRVVVAFADGDRVPARVVGWDLFSDVGLLRVDPLRHALAPIPLGRSAAVVPGEPVAVIGAPFGDRNSLSVGVVSAVRRSIAALTSGYDLIDAIQTDAAINHGNSGGPLLDASGRAIGLAAQIRTDSSGGEGVGFAVPIDVARRSLVQLRASGSVSYAFLGVDAQDLTPSAARLLGTRSRRGALVVAVAPGSPAARAGLRAGRGGIDADGVVLPPGGDVVLAIGGYAVRSSDDLVRIVAERLRAGAAVTVTVERQGRLLRVPVTLAQRPLER